MLQCFEFHDKHGRNRRKERICFDHEQVRDQGKCVLCGDCVRVMKFKALGCLLSRVINPTTVRGWTTSLSLLIFKLTAWIAANVYAYVHGHARTRGRNPRDQHEDKFEGFISFIFNNQCTIDLLKMKLKSFRTYPFATKQKILCGLKAYCYLGPACPGALEGPRTGGSAVTILMGIVII